MKLCPDGFLQVHFTQLYAVSTLIFPLPVSCAPPKTVDLLALNLSDELPDSLHCRDDLLLAAGGYSIRGKSIPYKVVKDSQKSGHGTGGSPPEDNNDCGDNTQPGPDTSGDALIKSPARFTRASRIDKIPRMSCIIELG